MNYKRINLNEICNDNYMKFYKFLFADQFKKMSGDAKILYTVLRDRLNLSNKSVSEGNNYWIDKNGDVFIHASKENIMDLMNCSGDKAIKLKKELVKFNLIEDVRVGQGNPNKIYIMNIDFLVKHLSESKSEKNTPKTVENTLKSKNQTSKSLKIELLKVQKSDTTKNEINKTENINNNYRKKSQHCNIMDNENKNPIEIIELKELFQEKIKKEVSEAYIKNLLKTFGYDNIFKVLNKFKKIRPANKIENIYGFINNAVKAEYDGNPYTENASVEAVERKKEGYKPEQSKNFEQREYDDEFFESLYDNF